MNQKKPFDSFKKPAAKRIQIELGLSVFNEMSNQPFEGRLNGREDENYPGIIRLLGEINLYDVFKNLRFDLVLGLVGHGSQIGEPLFRLPAESLLDVRPAPFNLFQIGPH